MDIVNVIKSLGIAFVVIAVVYLLEVRILRRIMQFLKKGKRLYLAAIIRLALAIVFLLGARECNITWVIFAFGILFLVSALLIFILGTERLRPIIDWYLKQSDLLLRVIALITLAAGVIIIYCA